MKDAVKERLLIYVAGTLIGSGIAYYYYRTHKNDKFSICKLLVIVNVIKLGFTMFSKSPLMLYSLTSKDQTDAWADIYSCSMKNRWIYHFHLDFSYIFLSLALVK